MLMEINGNRVPVTSSNHKIVVRDTTPLKSGRVRLTTIVDSDLFRQWLSTIDEELTVHSIEIAGVTMFGPRPGFIYLNAEVTDADGNFVPGAVFLRGDSVAILVELMTHTGKRYAVLTRQARFPSGGYLLETPAGMMDGDGNFKGKAIDELEEEVPALSGMFTSENIRPLCEDPIWISPGGCNERMGFYHLKLLVDDSVIDEIQGSDGGEGDYENIKVHVMPWDELYKLTDAKLLIALSLYQGEDIDKIKNMAEDLCRKMDEVLEAIKNRDDLRWLARKVDDNLLGGALKRLLNKRQG